MKQDRLVLFPLPFQGHINPMIQLAHILDSQGFNISIIHTEFNFPDTSSYPHFTFHVISDVKSVQVDGKTSTDPVLIIKVLNATLVEPFSRCLDHLLSTAQDHQVIRCLITDANWFFTQDVAHRFKLPRIVMRTSSICSFLAFAALPILQEKGYLHNRDSKMEEPVVEFPPLKVKDIPLIEIFDPENSYKMISNMVQATTKASGIIFNTFKELEESELAKLQQHYLMPAFVIGPFHKYFSAASTSLLAQDRTAITWLDTQAPKTVLYVSFGSIISIEKQELHEIARGLANSMQPFLWVVRPGLVREDSEWSDILPQGFMEKVRNRAKIVKWAPQQEVLSHEAVGGFWTHCGWNSTIESICEGVPMICSCFFGDQMVNSRFVNDVWEIGIKLEKGFDSNEIEFAIRKLLVEEAGDEIRQRSVNLKERINIGLSSGQSLHSLVDFIRSL